MAQLFANNASTILNGAINNSTTTIVVLNGAAFPAPGAGDFFTATLVGTDTNGNENAWEIVTVTARSGNTLTVVRGQEGTAAASWANGTRIELRLTAGAIENMGASVEASDTPPSGPSPGDLWFDSVSGNTFIWYDDGTSQQWVAMSNAVPPDGDYLPLTGGTPLTGDLNFSGTGLRIRGDFSNATVVNRLIFQTSTQNSGSTCQIVPSGTGGTAAWEANNNSDPTNSGGVRILATVGDSRIESHIRGAGAYLPMTFYTGGSERLRIDASGNVLVNGSGGLGYGVGSGGTASQPGQNGNNQAKNLSVTLNKPCGRIALGNAALAAGAVVSFSFNNSSISIDDSIVLSLVGSIFTHGNYQIWPGNLANGVVTVYLRNISGGSLSEAVVFNFAVIKGAAS